MERKGGGKREEKGLGHLTAISDIIGQALSQLFYITCYDNNAIRAGMNMFMSAYG